MLKHFVGGASRRILTALSGVLVVPRASAHLRIATLGLLLCFGGAAYAHHCSGDGYWVNTSGGQYVGTYYPTWSTCIATSAIGRKDTWEEWVAAHYNCRGVYPKLGGGSAYIGITKCVKSTATTGYCNWTDFGGQSGHEDNISSGHNCITCADNKHWTGQSACVLGNGDGSNFGGPACEGEGNPIHAKTGNKYQRETDYVGKGAFPLTFERHYNSYIGFTNGSLGPYWRSTYDRSLRVGNYGSFGTAPYQWIVDIAKVMVVRPDGQELKFTATVDVSTNYLLPDGTFLTAAPFVVERLQKTVSGFTLYTSDDGVETYDAKGKLLSIADRHGRIQQLGYTNGRLSTITDAAGRQLVLGYNAEGRVSQVTDPAGGIFQYGYDTASGRLTSVTHPALTVRTYLYEHATIAHLLTGIIDEKGDEFASFDYTTAGRANLSEHAGGASKVTLVYNPDGTTSVTDAINTTRTRSFFDAFGLFRSSGTSVPCPSCGGSDSSTTTYDANGFLDTKTDFNGNVTDYTYNSRGLEESRTEASNDAQLARTITTQWHASFRLPTQIDEPGHTTIYSYDGSGNRLTMSITDTATNESRTTTWTYNGLGQVLTVNGPRTDVSDITTYTYYDCSTGAECGQVHTITNALNQMTEIGSYDDHGNPLTIVDPNDVATTLTYDTRQRLATRTVAGATTTFEYDSAGLLDKVTLPDGSYLDYAYDAAHRLTDIEDGQGNRIHYTLDALGNRTKEEVFDPADVLKRIHTSVFNSLGRLHQLKNAGGQTVAEHGYDDNGNRISETTFDGTDTFISTTAFDALNRVKSATDAANGIALYGYDALDHLTSVTDPSGLVTTYAVNAFGDRTLQISPDSGTTSYTHDAAGHVKSETNASGFIRYFTYDALNRVISRNGDTHDQITYQYDGSNYTVPALYGVGRLTGVKDASGAYTYLYDARGNLISESKQVRNLNGALVSGVVFTTSYEHDSADRLKKVTYPTGRIIDYVRDAAGNVTKVTSTDAGGTVDLATDGAYEPFGPLASTTLGNGFVEQRAYDLDARLSRLQVGSILDLTYGYDERGNITATTEALGADRDQALAYDAVSRLMSAAGSYGVFGYTYDPTGHRLTRTLDGQVSNYFYNAGTHRLKTVTGAQELSYSLDARGNATRQRDKYFEYTGTGNWPAHVTSAFGTPHPLADFVYNAANQRVLSTWYVQMTNSSISLVSHYDREGHLIAETCTDGRVVAEYAYLHDRPLATWAVRKQPSESWSDQLSNVCAAPGVTFDLAYGTNADTAVFYHFDQEDVAPPLSAHTTPDAGPAGLTGTLGGSVLPVFVTSPSALGNALRFDGVQRTPVDDQRVDVPAATSHGMAGKEEWVLDVLVTPEVYPAGVDARFVIAQRYTLDPAFRVDWQLSLQRFTNTAVKDDNLVRFAFTYWNASGGETAIDFGTTTWGQLKNKTRHIRIEFDASEPVPFLFFIDDQLAGSSGSKPYATALNLPLRVGSHAFYGRAWGGVIDELRIASADAAGSGLVDVTGSIERELFFYVNDHLDTPQKLVDQSQAVVWDAVYEPFGGVTFKTQEIVSNLRRPGQYFDVQFASGDPDEVDGLYYNWHRTYDPSVGRYLQSDPIGLDAGLNTYAYVENQPTVFVDPTGLVKWTGSITLGKFSYGPKIRKIPVPIFGWADISLDLKSDCVDGKRVVAMIDVDDLQSEDKRHFGFVAALGSVEIEDGQPYPAVSSLEGAFNIDSFNFASGVGTLSTGLGSGTFDWKGIAFGWIRMTGAAKRDGYSTYEECCQCR